MARRFLYLVRHGQQAAPERPPDVLGNGLTTAGRRQARRVAARLSTVPVAVIHHSTMRRAAETAAIIAKRLPQARQRPSRQLWEIAAVSVPEAFREWFASVPRDEIERGRQRAEAAYLALFKPAPARDRHEVVVCHGNLIRYFVCRGLGLPLDVWVDLDTNNGGLTHIAVDENGRLRLLSFNDVGHLPPGLRTFL
jgi:broad specificity phosphatase PhoE